MIDKDGYRANVGIVIINKSNKLLWAKRKGRASWQFPQGGIADGERAIDAVYRELYEETGLLVNDVEILGKTKMWLRYVVPKKYRRKRCRNNQVCIGQKQKWFIMRLVSDESKINLAAFDPPEFDGWRWINYWESLDEVVYFKRAVYRNALCELSHFVLEPEKRYLPKKYRIPYGKKALYI